MDIRSTQLSEHKTPSPISHADIPSAPVELFNDKYTPSRQMRAALEELTSLLVARGVAPPTTEQREATTEQPPTREATNAELLAMVNEMRSQIAQLQTRVKELAERVSSEL